MASNNGGTTIHAYGTKIDQSTFGTKEGKPITDTHDQPLSVMHQAIHTGFPVGLMNRKTNTEPGTA